MKPILLYPCLFVLAAGCKQNREIKVYRVAKEDAPGRTQASGGDPHAGVPGMMPGGVMAGAAGGGDPHAGLSADQLAGVGMGGGPQVTDTPPSHWKKQAGSSMRLASYLVEGEGGSSADISLITLRGAAGGTLANVNRWRDQLGQPPIDGDGLRKGSVTIRTAMGEALVVDIEGLAAGADPLKDGRLIGGIADKEGDAWFFKMRGNSALTKSQKDDFIAWMASVRLSAAPASDPQAPAGSAPPVDTGDGSLSWEVPAGWVQAKGSNSMRYATFSVPGGGGESGEISVTHFPGDVGGDLENVNRWRQQVSLPPVDAAGLASLITTVKAGPKAISMIDITGPQARLAAGWTRHGPDTWFFKFTGPDALVAAESAKFSAFLESIRFNHPE